MADQPPAGLNELNQETAALQSAHLSRTLLDERKDVPKYKAVLTSGSASPTLNDTNNDGTTTCAGQHDTDGPRTSTNSKGLLTALGHRVDAEGVQDTGASAATPTSSSPAVTFRLVPEYQQVGLSPTTVKAVISLQATSEVSKPADVALVAVIDKSGSMSGPKLKLVPSTISFLVDKLKQQDALGLVTYGDQASRNMPIINMTDGGKKLARSVNAAIRACGGTALHAGFMMGISEHAMDAATAGPRRVRGVFLCTDGQPNVGPSDAMSIVKAMRAQLAPLTAQGEQVAIHTFGFGSDHDPKLLQAIAEAGNGIYYYIQDHKEIPEAFGDALGSLLSVVASNVTVTATLLGQGGSLTWVEASSSQERPTPGQVRVRFPDLFAEEGRDMLLELELPAATQDGPQHLVEVEVAYTLPGSGEVVCSSQVLALDRTAGAPTPERLPDPLVAATAERFRVAEVLRAAAADSDRGHYDMAATRVQQSLLAVSQNPALGDSQQAFVTQLSSMAHTISSMTQPGSSQVQRTAASTIIQSASHSMYQQRSAYVGLTSSTPPATYVVPAGSRPQAAVPALPAGGHSIQPTGSMTDHQLLLQQPQQQLQLLQRLLQQQSSRNPGALGAAPAHFNAMPCQPPGMLPPNLLGHAVVFAGTTPTAMVGAPLNAERLMITPRPPLAPGFPARTWKPDGTPATEVGAASGLYIPPVPTAGAALPTSSWGSAVGVSPAPSNVTTAGAALPAGGVLPPPSSGVFNYVSGNRMRQHMTAEASSYISLAPNNN